MVLKMSILNPRKTGEYVEKLAQDVTLNRANIKLLAKKLLPEFREKKFRLDSWKENELHPKELNDDSIHWIFVADVLNFSFWTSCPEEQYVIKYNGKIHKGYWTIHAAIHRALHEGIPITDVNYFANVGKKEFRHILRSSTKATIPLFEERYDALREAGQILLKKFDGSFVNCIHQCDHSAQNLVKLIVENFPSFKDEAEYAGHQVSFYKRAQIVVADIWACFQGKGLGYFRDIDFLTMFADYRVPQALVYFGTMEYSEELKEKLLKGELLENGSRLEVEIRGCSIAAIELLKQEVDLLLGKEDSEKTVCNSCIIDFYLWEYRRMHAKEIAKKVPFHKVRTIYY